jgi:hypothetical protein
VFFCPRAVDQVTVGETVTGDSKTLCSPEDGPLESDIVLIVQMTLGMVMSWIVVAQFWVYRQRQVWILKKNTGRCLRSILTK